MKINKNLAKGLTCAFLASLVFGAVAPSFAQEAAQVAADVAVAAPAEAVETVADSDRVGFFSLFGFLWILSLAGAIAALVFAVKFFKTMMKADEGNEEMIKIAAAVRKGANAYLKQQYKVVAIFFVVIWAFLMYLAWGPGVQNKIVPWAFLTGGFFSGLAGWFGMKTATW
ncbi:MAG: sodium/proton-translocating pyrophosphatase, partial [Thermoguttaceae bacterium]|nr:sodium/proton-translocating pyrophosphatase [Thermoguttaceae bacterium]